MSYCSQCGAELPLGALACAKCGRPSPGGAQQKKSNRTMVFVLVGCAVLFVGVAVLGIVAAILIPNFLDGMQKAKQKRTVAELRTIAAAVEGYRAEHEAAPVAHDIDGLAQVLGAANAGPIPRLDGWQRPFRYECWQSGDASGSSAGAAKESCDHYRVGSGGRDGQFDKPDLRSYGTSGYTSFAPTDYDRDIVLGDGIFVTWPELAPPAAQ